MSRTYTNNLNPLSTNPAKWSNTLKFRWQQPANCLVVFDRFVGLVLKGLKSSAILIVV